MKDKPFQDDREQLKDLLKQYENLKKGRHHSFLEEEAFEKIIDHFQERDELSKSNGSCRSWQ